MAHELDMSAGAPGMAYVGQVPWHGLGQKLAAGEPIETWVTAAGMNWSLEEHPCFVLDQSSLNMMRIPGSKALQRSDTRAILNVVSERYKAVQPREVLEFFRDIVKAGGLELDTAGVLLGGRRYWALAKLGRDAKIMGMDKLEGYLLLASSCDGSLATTGKYTSVRTVCNNTLQLAINENGRAARDSIKVPHSRVFDAKKMQAELGLASASWDQFIDEVDALARRKVPQVEAKHFLMDLLGDVDKDVDNQRTVRAVFSLFNGEARGAQMKSANGTAWGLVNSITEYFDHHRATRSQDARLNRSWFGDGATVKARAWLQALSLVE